MIRLFEKEDYSECVDFCLDHKIDFPHEASLILVSVNETGGIDGIAGLVTEYRVEPLIAKNPRTGDKLARMIEGFAVGSGIKTLKAHVQDSKPEMIGILEKEDFVIIDKNVTIMEKKYHG